MERVDLPAYLVPTSQSTGGEVHDNSLAMTAPGSQPISAPAANAGQAPENLPLLDLGTPQIEVNSPHHPWENPGPQNEGFNAGRWQSTNSGEWTP